jgi:hypothetical protein
VAEPLEHRDRLQQRLTSLRAERSSWMSHWEELASYLLPRSGRFVQSDRNRGERRHNSIYDNTGTRAVRVLGAGMQAGMTSPARPWFALKAANKELNKAEPVRLWLSEVTQLLRDVFARSNTYRALHAGYEELGVFGTSAKLMDADFDSIIHHTSLTAGEYCIAVNGKGEVDTLYRECDKTVYELVALFGRDACSTTVQNLYDRGALDQWVPVIHAIEPRTARDPSVPGPKNMAWRSCYFEAAAPKGQYLRDSGFKRFPGLVSRWAVTPGDIYGTSPAMDALGDVKQLQHEQKRKAQAIDYQTMPPLQAPMAMRSSMVDMVPGGITFADAASPSGGIKSLFEARLDLSHLLLDIQDVRERVNAAFFADLFLMLANSSDTTQRTAAEIAERHEEKLLMLGPTTERQHNEELQPLVEGAFQYLVEAGVVPLPPQELAGMELQVEYTGLLAQAQRAVGINSVDRFVGSLGVIAGLKPDVLDKFDADEWADVASDMLGVDPSLIVADDKVQLIRQQRAQQQAALQQSAMVNQAADTMQKLGSTPTTGDNAAAGAVAALTGY